jgi:hypothetical protein
VALAAGCGGEPTVGDPNEVVAVVAPEVWGEMEEDLREAIERRVSGVRDERVFTLVPQEPYGEAWDERSRAPLLLVVGTPGDEWMQEALAEAEVRPGGPGLYRATNVWADGQVVNALVVQGGGDGHDLEEHLEGLYAQLHADFRALVRGRLFASGADTELADTLWEREGFGILIPNSYSWTKADSTFLFRPDSEEEAGVERLIAVTWLNPAPSSLEMDEVLAWRARPARAHYGEPQQVGARVTAERLSFAGYVALEIRGPFTRRGPEGERHEGSLLTRVAVCEGQNRAYLLDSWVLAPGEETWEYVVQLETILDTFRCE